MIEITQEQAKVFLLAKQGLINPQRYEDTLGILEYVKHVGCLQFDPIDICGRNADIVLFSRIKNYSKDMLDYLLYDSRQLVDQWDKNMAIYCTDDWNAMKPMRQYNARDYERNMGELQEAIDVTLDTLQKNEFISSKDLDFKEDANFYTWRHRKLSQAILDYLFFKGVVVIHHRDGVKRYFGLSQKYLDASCIADDGRELSKEAFHIFQLKRRIGAIGLLTHGASDAYLGIYGMTAAMRRKYYEQLVERDEICRVHVLGFNEIYYMLKEDIPFLEHTVDKKRVEFLAPLDNFMWDRKLIKRFFDFSYTWEVYTVPSKRRFAPYVLPILYGTEFVGRVEVSVDRKQKQLIVKNVWFEDKELGKMFWTAFNKRMRQFATFNQCVSLNTDLMNVYTYTKL